MTGDEAEANWRHFHPFLKGLTREQLITWRDGKLRELEEPLRTKVDRAIFWELGFRRSPADGLGDGLPEHEPEP